MFIDPLALNIEWTSLDNRKGTSFQTHEDKHVSSKGIDFHRTCFMKVFSFILFLFPLVFIRLLITISGFPGIFSLISRVVIIIVLLYLPLLALIYDDFRKNP